MIRQQAEDGNRSKERNHGRTMTTRFDHDHENSLNRFGAIPDEARSKRNEIPEREEKGECNSQIWWKALAHLTSSRSRYTVTLLLRGARVFPEMGNYSAKAQCPNSPCA